MSTQNGIFLESLFFPEGGIHENLIGNFEFFIISISSDFT